MGRHRHLTTLLVPGSLLALTCLSAAAPARTPGSPQGEAVAAPAQVTEEVAVIKTNLGDIVLRFFPDVAPNHVHNFKFLAKNGIFDGTYFHRVIPRFMIQGGDPNTKDDDRSNDGFGHAGPGVKAEFSAVPHRRGILSMARKQDPNSATSQFFIMVGDKPGLDHQYSVFGMVIAGMDVVDRIVALPRDRANNPLPQNPAIIESVTFEKRGIAPRPSWTRP